jgi:hypothetical protein
MPEQLQFPFPSLDFPGRSTLLVWEIAERLGVSEKHLFNEVDEGALTVLDLKAAQSSRRCARVPIECYRDYVLGRLTGPLADRAALLRNLPAVTRRQLIRELQESLQRSA